MAGPIGTIFTAPPARGHLGRFRRMDSDAWRIGSHPHPLRQPTPEAAKMAARRFGESAAVTVGR